MKNNNISLSLYTCLSYYFYSFLILNNLSFKINENVAFLLPIILCIFSLILFSLLPKYSLKEPINKFIIFILNLYSLLSSVLLIWFSSKLLSYYFYNNNSFILIVLLLLFICFLISTFKQIIIFDIATTVFIIVFILNFVVLLNTSTPSFNLIHNINFNLITNNRTFLILSMLFILLDPITFYLNNLSNNANIRKCISISSIISMIFSSIFIFINYLYYSKEYLNLNIYPFFTALNSFLGPEFIDHFTIIILINTVTFTLLKISFNLNLSSFFTNENIFNKALFTLTIFIICFIIMNINVSNFLINILLSSILTIILIIIYLYIIRKGARYANSEDKKIN